MHFAGRVWRLLVGIKDALVLVLVLLFLWGIYTVLTARPSAAAVREGALVIELDGFVVEEAEHVDPLRALIDQRAPVGKYQARDIVRALDTAAKDDRIKAVVFDLDRFLGGGQVHMAEIGDAIARLRAAKKPVLTYATAYGDDAMLLAGHASEIWINPQGGAMIAGPGGANLYYAGLLDKLGVTMHVYKAGTYKSAVEPFIQPAMSDPARENATALYGALWEEYRAALGKVRPQAKIASMISDPVAITVAAGGNMAAAARASGLVDRIGSRVAFGERLQKIVGRDDWDELPGAYPSTGLDDWLAANPPEQAGAQIGVVTIAGEIVDGEAGPGTAGGDRIAALLDQAYADNDLAALVVRVDSPGGSVMASEVIREAVARHRKRRIPVAVSMANVAASGGYWVATASDRIFAEPDTITGSIGVFGVLPSFENAAAKLGITTDGVRTGPLSGQPDLVAGLSPEVNAIAQAGVEHSYRAFLARVSTARRLPVAAVDRVAQGRVWDGGSARQLGLVDQYGGIEDALAWAAKAAKLAPGEWHPVYLGAASPDAYDTILGRWLFDDDTGESATGRDILGWAQVRQHTMLDRVAQDLARLESRQGYQALCLECGTPSHSPPPGGSAASMTWLGALAKMVLR